MNAYSLSFAVLSLLAAAGCATAPASPPPVSSIGYSSVAEAMAALRARPDVEIAERDGWTIVTERSNHVIWSFTPAGHPAHPAAVKRTVVQMGDGIGVQMNVLCQARKADCDTLVAEFQALNERMRQDIQRTAPRRVPPAGAPAQTGT